MENKNSVVDKIVRDCLEENYQYGFSLTFSDLLDYQFAIRLDKTDLDTKYSGDSDDNLLGKLALEAHMNALLKKLKEYYEIESFDQLNEIIAKYYNVRAREVVYGS